MEVRKHYKMFKSGKQWVYAGIATASFGLAGIGNNVANVHADTTENKDSVRPIDQNTTTAPVSEASVKLTQKSTTQTSASSNATLNTSSAAVSSSASSAAQQQNTKATSSVSAKTSTAVAPTSSAAVTTAKTTTTAKSTTNTDVEPATAKTSTQKSYTVDNTYKLAEDEGSDQKTNNKIIVAHATGTYAPAKNVATFEKREWSTDQTYVQYIVGDGGKVYAVGEEGYVAWGAGQWANENAPVQVELAQTYSDAQFKKDYTTYVNLLRDSAQKWNIPVTLDDKKYVGIKSHVWITNNVWGNHVDPYGYLATHGVSQSQFARDLQYGFNSNSNETSTNNTGSNSGNSSNDSNNVDNSKIKVGSNVTIKTSAKKWATGQDIYGAVKGKTYKVIQTNGSRLLLDKVVSWINSSDVTVPGSTSANHNTTNSGTNNKTSNTKIGVGSNVTIKTSAKKWATGQDIYGAVKGKTYKVIQTNGSRLLLDKVVSWINKADVTVPGASANNTNNSQNTSRPTTNTSQTIKVGSSVTIKTNAKKWATGQDIYGAVKGKTYKVIQTNGSRLLLDKVVSWINKSDVTVPGGTTNAATKPTTNKPTGNANQSTIGVGSNVTIKSSAKRWATGQNIYDGVKGKTYKVIQTNGSRLLLDKVVSWINKSDVTVPGSNTSSNSAGNSSSSQVIKLSNNGWTSTQTNFVNQIAADVMSVCKDNGLYASVAMAQAVLESAYGTSGLAKQANNLFGIKADKNWTGDYVTMKTQEVINGRTVTVNAKFRKYSSIKDSIADYAKKLQSRPQYSNAFTNKAANYIESIKAIKAGGYATSTTYVSSLINCVNTNGFYKLDGRTSAITL
ncbi:N-acetylmuramidase [Pediococcus stilesii]|uniref:N-acetylmuramidase n=1 Tax=Pediococcus stilesii TaxID=331679 RepID=A0A5R9BS60_9LACO|nr:glucosaminidase domain-containing protein [Pediococcus stilesii]TLQ03419.1 N-acetylmuramidase [Pediococcus stilesii]